MTTIIQKLWMFITVLCASLSASASGFDFSVDGLAYTILSEKYRRVEVSGVPIPRSVGKNIDIPREIIYKSKTYTVTSIGYGAFHYDPLTSVTIPNSVTSIGDMAFIGCSKLTSVTIPDSVTSIGERAFKGCGSLTSVTIGNSVTSIGERAFNGCGSLTSVTIGNSVTSIGERAFNDCSSLTSVTIPNSVTSIGDRVFNGCSSLTSVTIGNSVTSIASMAFRFCSSLKYINVDSENPTFSSIEGILYNKDATSLITCPEAKTSVTIPNSVTSIGDYAFTGCDSLTSVTIPNSVTSIGDYAFTDCDSLTSVTIPNSVSSIGDYAFQYCNGLTSVTIGNSVTSIGDYAFTDCYSLKTIYMQCKVPIKCYPNFSESVLRESVLYIPTGTRRKYREVVPWSKFWNIEEMEFSGIDGIEADEYGSPVISVNNGILTINGIGSHESVTVYDMQGRVFYNGTSHIIDKLTPGLYIVKAGSRTIKISI